MQQSAWTQSSKACPADKLRPGGCPTRQPGPPAMHSRHQTNQELQSSGGMSSRLPPPLPCRPFLCLHIQILHTATAHCDADDDKVGTMMGHSLPSQHCRSFLLRQKDIPSVFQALGQLAEHYWSLCPVELCRLEPLFSCMAHDLLLSKVYFCCVLDGPYGCIWTRMPFGLVNASSSFLRVK